jgi:CRP/FNR family transcriptional regulator, cyclic AMP receptor protein
MLIEQTVGPGFRVEEIKSLSLTESVLEQVGALPIFRELDPARYEQILKYARFKQYDAGEVIIEEGVYDQFVYVLVSGSVSVLKGMVEINRLQRAGDVFGEMGIIDGKVRSATVQALRPTNCLALDCSLIDQQALEDRAMFLAILYRVLAENLVVRLRKANEEISAMRAKF